MYQEDVEVRPFNLYMAGNLVHELKPFIQHMAQQCGQKFELQLSQILQTDVEIISSFDISQRSLKAYHDEEFYRCWFLINEDENNYGTFAVGRAFAGACLDILCGGSGTHVDTGNKTDGPTNGEIRALNKITTALFDCFEEVYQAIMPLRLTLTNRAQDAAVERGMRQGKEYIVSSDFHIKAGNAEGVFQLRMPASVLANTGLGNRKKDKQQMEADLKQAISNTQLPVTAIIGQQADQSA